MLPRSKLKVVGPTGWSADQGVGRSTSGANRPQLLAVGPVWAWPGLNTGVDLVLSSFASVIGLLLVHLSLNQCSDIFCDFLPGQSVLVTCILAQKHILHILEGKVWFRDFIEYKCVQEMKTLMIF